MTSNELHDKVIDLYDRHILASTDPAGCKVHEAKTAIRVEVRRLVARAKRDVDVETDALITGAINPKRSQRSRSLRTQLDYILDGLQEDGIYIDPLLDQAFSLGSEHGVDKALRHWTKQDFIDLTVTRYRVAAESTKAAADFDATAQRVLDRMSATGAATFGQADWTGPAGGAA